jgi:hypothetical protein
MAQWGLNLIFEARGRGWKEVYVADFATSTFEGMLPFAQKLAAARIALAAAPVEIKAYEVVDPLTEGRQGRTFYFKPRYAAPAWVGNDGATDPATSVNVEFIAAAGGGRRRQIQLRGCPDGLINNYGELTGPLYGAWEAQFLAYRLVVLGLAGGAGNANYGWFRRVPTAVPAGIVSYTFAVGAFTPTLNLPADFFPLDQKDTNQYVRIRGVNGGKSALNGEQVVRVVERNQATLTRPLALGPQTTTGFMQRYTKLPVFVQADNVGIVRAGKRSPGRPLLYTPGRRPNRARS